MLCSVSEPIMSRLWLKDSTNLAKFTSLVTQDGSSGATIVVRRGMPNGFKTSTPSMRSIGSSDSNKISRICHQFGGKIAKCPIHSLPQEAVVSLTSPSITRVKDFKETTAITKDTSVMIVTMVKSITILQLHMQPRMIEVQTV